MLRVQGTVRVAFACTRFLPGVCAGLADAACAGMPSAFCLPAATLCWSSPPCRCGLPSPPPPPPAPTTAVRFAWPLAHGRPVDNCWGYADDFVASECGGFVAHRWCLHRGFASGVWVGGCPAGKPTGTDLAACTGTPCKLALDAYCHVRRRCLRNRTWAVVGLQECASECTALGNPRSFGACLATALDESQTDI